ncbi:tetrathionate reductase [candidate division LCP-89 bacterium B3_LCP]|uniref:Tetrathionate reductase n=1 Tax=candidate division LCP-89 bacterium B3_LCP TaxID=2012998 RepID=A0A532UW12_UNCL8|nr:MAG: tetrathionate reductase [candidate division LCP-89 bacterium B3_LCP]
MARYGMVIDTHRCVGCHSCVISCFMENSVPEGYKRDWIVEVVSGEFPNFRSEIRSERCNHCDNPPCVFVCPCGASYVEEGTGTVLVHNEKCTGCKACIAACPYDARFINPAGFADKCTFCDHRVKDGLLPGCATTCPTKAINFGDLDQPGSHLHKLMHDRSVKSLKPSAGTGPNVYYLL